MKALKLVVKILAPFLLLAFIAIYWLSAALNIVIEIPTKNVNFEVEKGESFQHILLRLEKDYGFDQRLAIKVYCKISQQCTGIKQGEYVLPETITLKLLLATLKKGDVKQYKFTIIEGWRTADMLRAIKELPNLEHELLSVDEQNLMQAIGLDSQHPEGLFLAETYFYKKGDSDISLLLRAHKNLNEVLQKHWQSRDLSLPYKDSYEALIMASIVEKETSIASERNQIAGVFIRRLQQNWKLQTDPTVIYGLGTEFDGNLKRKHLKQQTAYNTYVNKGLPPTPIALVGEDAILAALHPADGKEMYFVAKGDGSHFFSETLKQHEQAVDQFQRTKRQKNYRSYPFH